MCSYNCWESKRKIVNEREKKKYKNKPIHESSKQIEWMKKFCIQAFV